jgi:hypothetical protein
MKLLTTATKLEDSFAGVNDLTDFLNAQVNPLAPAAHKPALTAKK